MDEKYKYSYENDSEYCYPKTDILKNKLNITDDKFLNETERKLVSLRVDELFEPYINGNFDFMHLKEIHKHLFQDIYDWAGAPRTCAIAKKDLFCLPQYIDNYASDIFSKLEKENYYINHDYDSTLNLLVELFADINALHPFREGNGRSQREFIEELAKVNGIDLDLTKVEKMDMIIASHESINGDYEKLTKMFYANSNPLSKDEQLKYINMYCSEKLKKFLINNI